MSEAVSILQEALARGDISIEEYKQRLAVLRETTEAPSPRPEKAERPLEGHAVLRYFDRTRPLKLMDAIVIAGVCGAAVQAIALFTYTIGKGIFVDGDIVDSYDYYRLGIFILLVLGPFTSLALAVLLSRRPSVGSTRPIRFALILIAAMIATVLAYAILGSISASLLGY